MKRDDHDPGDFDRRMLVIDPARRIDGIVRVRGYMENGRPTVEFTLPDEEPAPRRRFPRPLRRLWKLLSDATIREVVERILDSDAVERILDSDAIERLLHGLGINRKAAAARCPASSD